MTKFCTRNNSVYHRYDKKRRKFKIQCQIPNFNFRTNVIVGEYDITHHGKDCATDIDGVSDCTDGAISIPVEDIQIHPSYSGEDSSQGDIALIRLAKAVPYTGKLVLGKSFQIYYLIYVYEKLGNETVQVKETKVLSSLFKKNVVRLFC